MKSRMIISAVSSLGLLAIAATHLAIAPFSGILRPMW
jgi:hypothetical protein